MTIRSLLEEGLIVHGLGSRAEPRLAKVQQTLAQVGLDPSYIHRYPHEFSGGQRQALASAGLDSGTEIHRPRRADFRRWMSRFNRKSSIC